MYYTAEEQTTMSWHTLKSGLELLNFFSSLLPRAAQTVQTEEFMFQNVAYRPTVYKTGAIILEGSTFSS